MANEKKPDFFASYLLLQALIAELKEQGTTLQELLKTTEGDSNELEEVIQEPV